MKEFMKIYNSELKKAQKLYAAYNEKAVIREPIRIAIADISIKMRGMTSLGIFAGDLGIRYSTLMRWVHIREIDLNIENALSELYKDSKEEIDTDAVNEIKPNVTTKTSTRDIIALYNSARSMTDADKALMMFIEKLNTMNLDFSSIELPDDDIESLEILKTEAENFFTTIESYIESCSA